MVVRTIREQYGPRVLGAGANTLPSPTGANHLPVRCKQLATASGGRNVRGSDNRREAARGLLYQSFVLFYF